MIEYISSNQVNEEEIKRLLKIKSMQIHPDKNHAPQSTTATQKLNQ
jgi:curved DNA-binding protein CbpA